MQLTVIEDGAFPAALNMALDLSLLESDGAHLRYYGWDSASLSLGCFQPWRDFAELEGCVPFVRRPTGGGAILHDRDITFALVVPESQLPGPVRASYRLVNAAVRAAVASMGAAIRDPTDGERNAAIPDDLARWCFARPTGLDLVLDDGRKVFGSAQRRARGRVLHHGSLILERSRWTPFAGALADVGPTDAVALRRRLTAELAAALGLAVRCSVLPEGIHARAARLAAERFACSKWTQRR